MEKSPVYLVSALETEYYALSKKLAAARVRYSQEFQIAKTMHRKTDTEAHQVAIEKTTSEITVIEAAIDIARARLQKGQY